MLFIRSGCETLALKADSIQLLYMVSKQIAKAPFGAGCL